MTTPPNYTLATDPQGWRAECGVCDTEVVTTQAADAITCIRGHYIAEHAAAQEDA